MPELVMQAGAPFARDIRVIDAKNYWSSLDRVEVRAQLRKGVSVSDELVTNLHSFMVPEFDGNDILIRWRMDAMQTTALVELMGKVKLAHFNVSIASASKIKEKSIVSKLLTIRGVPTTTIP